MDDSRRVLANVAFILYRVVLIIIFCLCAFLNWNLGGDKNKRSSSYHLLLPITLFLSVCRSKASKIGVPKDVHC